MNRYNFLIQRNVNFITNFFLYVKKSFSINKVELLTLN